MQKQKEIRPLPQFHTDKTDYGLEAASVLGLLSMWIMVLIYFSSLPDRVPTHFNIYGQADGWGTKTNLFILPAISTLLLAGLTILNRFPHYFNYPVKVTFENAQHLYRKGVRIIRILKIALIVTFLFIQWHIIKGAAGSEIPGWFLPAILTITMILPIAMALFLTKFFSATKGKNQNN